ncbi:MAG: hypothetical protein IT426_09175 [Pirellulales bacterium]|nr:hypothetical protein [Pirellulales bacterium]
MRGANALLAIALGVAGCKTPAPTADPFINHPIVPPPATGACPTPSIDPGYAPNTLPAQPPPTQSGLPASNIVPPATGSPPPTYSNAGTTPGATAGGAWNSAGSTNLGTPGYGNSGSSAFPGSVPAAGNAAFGTLKPTIIPPPNTAASGGYPNAATIPSPAAPGPTASAMPADYRNGTPGGINGNARAMPAAPNSPISGTPRPTPTRAVNSNVRPAAAIPNNSTWDSRSPRPVDVTAQPLGRPSPSPSSNSSMGVAAPVLQPRAMPMAPTAYGSPLALPPYSASIQSIELDWQPCDGYADEGE